MKSRIFFFCISISLLSIYYTFGQTWSLVGPRNFNSAAMGVINQVFCHPENMIFASSPDGGLWICRDINRNEWAPISDYLENLEVRSFAVSNQRSNKIYLALNRNLLYKSVDLGRNWQQLSVGKDFGEFKVLKIHPFNDEIFYLGTSRGLYRSRNGGLNFELLRDSLDITDIAIDFTNPNIIYAGARWVGVIKSTDNGTQWTTILQSHITSGLRPSKVIMDLGLMDSVGIAETHTNRTILVKIGTRVHRSRDSGQYFVPLTNISSSLNSETGGGGSQRTKGVQRDWNNAVAISPFNSNTFLVGQERFYFTSNGGNTWSNNNEGIYAGHEDIHSLSFSPIDGNLVIVGNDGGVYKSRTTGEFNNFDRFFSGLVISQLLRAGIRDKTIVVNSDHNGLIGINDYTLNSNWFRAAGRNEYGFGNNSMERNGVFVDPNSDSRFFIFWNELSRLNFPRTPSPEWDMLPISKFRPFKITVFPDSAQGAILTTKKHFFIPIFSKTFIWVSSDRTGETNSYKFMYSPEGKKESSVITRTDEVDSPIELNLPIWKEAFDSGNNPIVAVKYDHRNKRIYCISSKGKLYSNRVRFFYRNQWTERNDFIPDNDSRTILDFIIDNRDSQKMYAISNDAMFISNNEGMTWEQILRNQYIPVHTYYSLIQLGNGSVVVSTNDGVYQTKNNGRTWIKLNGNLPNVKVSQLLIEGQDLFAVTFGRGMWKASIAELESF